MMARTKKDQLSYSAGERGRNRVRVFSDHGTGTLRIEWRENGRRRSKSLEHADWRKAKRQADEFAASYVAPKPVAKPEPEPLTLGTLFEMYRKEVTPTKSERIRAQDATAIETFESFLGSHVDPASLSPRDAERFAKARSEGHCGPGSTPVGPRTVEKDLRFLLAVLNWAAKAGDGKGGFLLAKNPLRGVRLPKEKNPIRVVLSGEEYERLLAIADQIDWRFRGMLVVAHETGHRVGSIRQLRWSDVDLDAGTIRWRGATEKTGYEHVTPITQTAHAALRRVQARNPGIGDAPVFPDPQSPARAVCREYPKTWWRRGERLAGLTPKKGRGWHSLRRKFASDLMHQPLKVLCELGGWKSPQTVLMCYQQPDEQQLRTALAARREAPNSGA